MSVVSEIAVKYATSGVKGAVRADRKVRDSIQTTAKTAQRESGTINRWMERHKSAIQAIGVATASVMGAIIAASPTMRAELGGVRTAFSLFADTIVNDVLPEGSSLSDLAFDLESAYNDLPGPIRKVISNLLFFGGAIGAAAVALAGLQSLMAGTVVAKGFAALGGAILSVAGLITGPMLLAIGALIVVGATLYLAWKNNWFGIRDLVGGVIDWVVQKISAFVGFVKPFWSRFLSAVIEGRWRDAWGAVRDFLAAIVAKLLGSARRLRARMRSVIEKLGAIVKTGFETMWDSAVSITKRSINGILSSIETGVNRAIKALNKLPNIDLGTVSLPRLERQSFDEIREGAKSQIQDRFAQIAEREQQRLDAISDRTQQRIEELQGTRSKAEEKMLSMSDLTEKASGMGESIAEGFSDGLDTGISALEDKLSGILGSALDPKHSEQNVAEQVATGDTGSGYVPAAEPPASAGSGGGNTTVVFEKGAIEVSGEGPPKRTAEKTAQEVSQAIQSEFSMRR